MATFYWWVDETSAHPSVIQSAETEKNEYGKNWVRFSSSSEAHAFVKKLKDKQYEESRQNERNKLKTKRRLKKDKETNNKVSLVKQNFTASTVCLSGGGSQ